MLIFTFLEENNYLNIYLIEISLKSINLEKFLRKVLVFCIHLVKENLKL